MPFTDEEIAYLQSQPLARFASVSADAQPDVVPLAYEFDGTYFWIGGSGPSVARTRKFRNVRSGQRKVALVIDDLMSFEPFTARCMRIYGVADEPFERVGLVGPGLYMRVTPTLSWSWNLEGLPVGAEWYEPVRTVHRPPVDPADG
ncbi:PPOX class F420-dependent oxidoreductase [Streptomyces sp. NPDC020141]|uniref:PPOX class F420-dependent oxidoreductase n=1 Tax=Streptomyces sp. NPDC020141 TaxID=3365065 RepID=UPI0037A2134B